MNDREATEARQYLSFSLADESFAVDVEGTKEILEYTAVTKVPKTTECMKGVINVRGKIVPVIDMRLKLGLPEAERTINTCIIVLEVRVEGEAVEIGALVDSVQEVFELTPGQVEPAPKIGRGTAEEFIKGMGKKEEGFVILLDVDRLFNTDDMMMAKSEEQGYRKVAEG